MRTTGVISALNWKRAQLASDIQRLEADLALLRINLEHIDGALSVFATDISESRATALRPRSGDMTRQIATILRESDTPVAARDISHLIKQMRGQDESDIKRSADVDRAVSGCLCRMKRRGLIVSAFGPDRVLRWSVAPG